MKITRDWLLKNQPFLVLAAVIAGIAVVLCISTLAKPNNHTVGVAVNNPINTSKQKLDNAEAKEMKALLDVYYVSNGTYPVNIDELSNDVGLHPNNYNSTSVKDVKKLVTALKNFNYSRTGDGSAYKFTYKDVNNQTITNTGNYQKDYH